MDYSHKIFTQRRTLIQFSLGFLFSGIFLYLFLKNFDFKSLLKILSQLVYYNFAWVFLATAAHLLAKAIRWKIILAPLKEITVISSLSNVSIGLMANNLLPARSGELVRVASLAQTEEISASSVLSALILERLLDGYILLLFFMFSSYRPNNHLRILKILKSSIFTPPYLSPITEKAAVANPRKAMDITAEKITCLLLRFSVLLTSCLFIPSD